MRGGLHSEHLRAIFLSCHLDLRVLKYEFQFLFAKWKICLEDDDLFLNHWQQIMYILYVRRKKEGLQKDHFSRGGPMKFICPLKGAGVYLIR